MPKISQQTNRHTKQTNKEYNKETNSNQQINIQVRVQTQCHVYNAIDSWQTNAAAVVDGIAGTSLGGIAGKHTSKGNTQQQKQFNNNQAAAPNAMREDMNQVNKDKLQQTEKTKQPN